MSQENDILIKLQTRVRQLIFKLQEVEDENVRLQETIKAKDDETTVLQQQLAQVRGDYERLKMAKLIELSFGDMDATKAKLSKLIKDLNKAITLLNAD